MEPTTERQDARVPAEDSDEALTETFRGWSEGMSREQVLYMLANGSAEDMVCYLKRKNIPLPADPHKVWRLLKAELVSRLQRLNAFQTKVGTA